MRIELPNNWWPRPYQKALWGYLDERFLMREPARAVCVWHRRAGKDSVALNRTIIETTRRIGVYYHCLPKVNQARKVLWDGITSNGRPFLDFWPKDLIKAINNTEMKIDTKLGSLWQLIGSDNYDNVMGTNPVGIVFSEYSLQDPKAWDYFRPILAENGGWAIFLYTPRGRNHGFDLYRMAAENPAWFCQTLTVDDTGAIRPSDIQAERDAGMNDDLIRQEFYCDFETSLPGAYYANEMRRARDDGRITNVPFQAGVPVDTWWDLGMDDSTSIWFSQDIGREVHHIDYYESRGEGLDHYARVLSDKLRAWGGTYGRHLAPHDIMVREIGSGVSRLHTAKTLGIPFEIAPRPAVKEEGIQAVRRIFPVCYFDKERCQQGIDGLSSYRSEYDETKKVLMRTPVHDWASHPADAFQTFALAHKFRQMMPVRDRYAPEPRKRGSWMAA